MPTTGSNEALTEYERRKIASYERGFNAFASTMGPNAAMSEEGIYASYADMVNAQRERAEREASEAEANRAQAEFEANQEAEREALRQENAESNANGGNE